MSLFFDVIKSVQGKPTDKATTQVRNQRLSICEACPHMQAGKVRSCGKFLRGGTVTHEGKEMELCGCNVDDKTWYKHDECPLNKW